MMYAHYIADAIVLLSVWRIPGKIRNESRRIRQHVNAVWQAGQKKNV